jgi:hypothetical protein
MTGESNIRTSSEDIFVFVEARRKAESQVKRQEGTEIFID